MLGTSEYGLWQLVIVNSLIVLFLAFSFFQPQTRRDWRTFGAFSAFVMKHGMIRADSLKILSSIGLRRFSNM